MQTAKQNLQGVLRTNPKFHRLVDIHSELDDTLTSWAAQLDVLEAMQAFLERSMRTLETGCGQSTIMFALNQVEHYCVTPAKGEADRVRAFCQDAEIDLAKVHFLIGDSQDELPRLHNDLILDLVFIDGGHFFPIPCIDWYYADKHLKAGGTLVIDDLCIPTVRMLYDVLHADKNWEQLELLGDTVIFRKLRHAPNLHDWIEQPFNQSFPDWSFLPVAKRALLKASALKRRARALLSSRS